MFLLFFLFQLSFAGEEANLIGVGRHFPLFQYIKSEAEDIFVPYTQLNTSCVFPPSQSRPVMEWYQKLDSRRVRVIHHEERTKWKQRFFVTASSVAPDETFTVSLFPKELLGNFILNNQAQVLGTKLGSKCYTLVTFRRSDKPTETLRLDTIRTEGETSNFDSPEKVTLTGVNLSTGEDFEFIFPEE